MKLDDKLKQQVKEWAESPINEKLAFAIEDYIRELEIGLDCFHPFEPQKTQETLAGINGSVDTWRIVIDLLNGDWEFLENE